MLSSSLPPPFLQPSLQVFFSFADQGLRLSRPPAAYHSILSTDQNWVWCGERTSQEANLVLSPSGFRPPLPVPSLHFPRVPRILCLAVNCFLPASQTRRAASTTGELAGYSHLRLQEREWFAWPRTVLSTSRGTDTERCPWLLARDGWGRGWALGEPGWGRPSAGRAGLAAWGTARPQDRVAPALRSRGRGQIVLGSYSSR